MAVVEDSLAHQALQDVDQLLVRAARWIAKLVYRVCVGEPAQAQELTEALPPVELQVRRTRGKEQPPELAGTEEAADFRRGHVD